MTPEVIGLFCRNGRRTIEVKNGLPADAKFVAAYYQNDTGYFEVCFESRELEPIPFGERLPRLLPVIATVDE